MPSARMRTHVTPLQRTDEKPTHPSKPRSLSLLLTGLSLPQLIGAWLAPHCPLSAQLHLAALRMPIPSLLLQLRTLLLPLPPPPPVKQLQRPQPRQELVAVRPLEVMPLQRLQAPAPEVRLQMRGYTSFLFLINILNFPLFLLIQQVCADWHSNPLQALAAHKTTTFCYYKECAFFHRLQLSSSF